MSAMDWAMGLFALVVGVGVLYFIFTQPPSVSTVTGPPTLTIQGLPTAYVGASHTVTVRVTGHGKEDILVRGGGVEQVLPCSESICSYSLPFTFTEEGPQIIHAESGYLSVDWKLDVKTKTSICLDGTPEGVCSSPPLRCVNQSLISDCSSCGCPSGESCVEHACTKEPFSFALDLGVLPTLYTSVAVPIPLVVTNTSPVSASGLFVGRVQWYDSSSILLGEQSLQFLLDDFSSGVSETYFIPVLLPKSASFLNVQWFPSGGVYDSSTLLAALSSFEKISVVEDQSPPSPPVGLDYSIDGSTLILSWSASVSSDVKEYIVHQQNAATGGFTTYSTVAITPNTSYSLILPPDGTAFVLTSRDEAGNESAPTSPIVVNAS